MKIPAFLDRDNYLQNPIMRRFLKEKGLNFVELRVEYINAIEEYANKNLENEKEVKQWLTKVVKEGSKEFCYRKIRNKQEWHKDPIAIAQKMKNLYPNCPMQEIFLYKNVEEQKLINWKTIENCNGEVTKIEFTFSQLLLYGEIGKDGDETPFPVFVDLYIDKGFIVGRAKAKSTVYKYDIENKKLFSDYKINTQEHIVKTMDKIIELFGFETEKDKKRVKTYNSRMLYKIYDKYTFTPSDVINKVNSMEAVNNSFVNKIFNDLNLDIRNKEKALIDAKIFIEKFISINGDNEEIFKEGRDAYLVKVSSDDESELTKIDANSDKMKPLQCTEALFDSKKSVITSKQCKKLELIFKRKNELYFTKNNPLLVKFGTNKNYGYMKTMQYAEEVDIQNVLQGIFENY